MSEEPTTNSGLPLGTLNFGNNGGGKRIKQSDEEKPEESKDIFAVASADKKPAVQDEYFNEYFTDDEDEDIEKIKAAPVTFKHQNQYNKIDEVLNKRLKTLREKFPMGGLTSFRFISTQELLNAPPDFFHRFETDVKEITNMVQTAISEKGQSDLVGAAQANPFDEKTQDIAFRAVQAVTSEFMSNMPYKGTDRSVIIYMTCMDIIGMSRIEPLWRDRDIDEIIINGPDDIQVEMRGQLYKATACRFRDSDHLENLLERIFSTIGKSLSRTTPYLDGRLYDQSRIAATHRTISPAGPNVAIRRHPEKYWTPMELIKFGAASEEMLTDVGNWINKGCSYIVIGGTSSGKTSLLNATSCFFDPEQRILTLEDNLELKLHPGKLVAAPMECVPPNPNKAGDHGITMRELVRACLRMRPDGIVIGEVRDGAMYDLCQALNTGHWGCSTVHANSPYDGIYRMQSLVTQAELIGPEQALPLIAAAFDFIIMQERFPADGSRKITSICEIDPYPSIGDDGRLKLGIRELWKFKSEEGLVDGKVKGTWEKQGDISQLRRENRHLDLTPFKTWSELVELCTIPDKLQPKH